MNLFCLCKTEKEYIRRRKNTMEYSAIFHDMDKRFCYAIEKDLFVIRVQVKKDDMKEIILHYEDKYIPMEREDTRKTIVMKKVATSQFNDYYEAQVRMHLICLRYLSQTETECLTVRRTFGRKKCLRSRIGQQIRSCIRSFHPVLQHHSR